METNRKSRVASVFIFLISLPSVSLAYRPGDIVPMSKKGQYHSSRTAWHDMIGKHCPIFAVNREVLIPIAKPTGYTGTDPYKLYSGSDLHGVTAKVIDMPHHYVETHPEIRQQFWDPQHWPKHILIRYTWKEQSEIDVSSGFYVLFGSGLMLSFILSIYILQSSRDKLARFVRETVAESSMPAGGVAKVE